MKLLHASHALHTDLGHQHETVAVGLTVFKHYVQMYKKKHGSGKTSSIERPQH